MRAIYISFIFILFFTGCGYKPSAHYAKHEIEGKVYVDLKLNITNGQNAVAIKDSVIDMILNRFNTNITYNKALADTIVTVSLSNVSHTPIASDNLGFAKSYRTSVKIVLSYEKKGGSKKTFTLENYYDYTIDSDSTLTQTKEQEAISIAASKALSDIFSKIAIGSIAQDGK